MLSAYSVRMVAEARRWVLGRLSAMVSNCSPAANERKSFSVSLLHSSALNPGGSCPITSSLRFKVPLLPHRNESIDLRGETANARTAHGQQGSRPKGEAIQRPI